MQSDIKRPDKEFDEIREGELTFGIVLVERKKERIHAPEVQSSEVIEVARQLHLRFGGHAGHPSIEPRKTLHPRHQKTHGR